MFHGRLARFASRVGAICKSIALFFLVNLWDNIQVAGGTSHNPPRAGLFNNLLQKENDMSNQSNDHVLPNGYTFLAIAGGYYGSWAKAHDPITAIKQVYKAEGGQVKRLVKVIYGKDDELHCTDMGAFQWEHGNPPTPIGLFTVTSRSIKPAECDETDPALRQVYKADHLGWMNGVQQDIEWQEKHHQERLEKEAVRTRVAALNKLGKLLPAT